jgi:hypothetical protein
MSEAVDNQLIFEVMKKVQADVSEIKADIAEVRSMQLRIREGFNRRDLSRNSWCGMPGSAGRL